MKKTFIILAACFMGGMFGADAQTWVNGYTRKDGTKVKSYQRTCGAKHDKRPKIPPLQNLSKDEIDKLS